MSALTGLRILDLSPSRVGAQASQLFADFGADVIWVEPPGGAALRAHPAYPFWTRGKQSIELDLRSDAGREQVLALARDADVLIESFRPGVLDRRGLGFDRLGSVNPRLVYTSITGFGREGPLSGVKAYEGLVAAKIGLSHGFSRLLPSGRPPLLGVPWCSFSASQVALHGTLAALLERESSGLGQHVDVNLAQSFYALDTWGWFEHLVDEKWPGAYNRVANFDEAGRPTGPFPCFLLVGLTKDGHWLQFAQVAPHLFQALIRALDLGRLFTDEAWKGFPMLEDPERRLEAWKLLQQGVRSKTLAEWQAIFEADPNIFAEEFRAGPEILDHRQLEALDAVVEIEDAEHGAVRQPGPLARLHATPAQLGASAPRLNEHRPLERVDATAERVEGADGPGPVALPLEGVTILELAGLFAAPFGATLLADLGARVIKVEPLEGDAIRTIIPFPEAGGAKVMQGKESVCVDFATEEGLALVHRLAARADVVMQGFRAGVAERLGLGFAHLRALNPDLIYVNAQGYGNAGPDGHRPAYAPSFGAAAGIARTSVGALLTQERDLDAAQISQAARQLTVGGTMVAAQADGFAALGVATTMLLGLLTRARGQGGQEVDATMLVTSVHAMSAQAVVSSTGLTEPMPDAELRGIGALYRVYDTRDGWAFLAAPAPHEWAPLVAALAGHVDLASDARFESEAARAEHDAELTAVLAGVFETRSASEWEADLLAADVGCVAVATDSVERVLAEEGFGRAHGYLVDTWHPTFDEHARLAPLVRMSRSATRAEGGVLAGAHTDSVLEELGFDPAQVADLRERKIIG